MFKEYTSNKSPRRMGFTSGSRPTVNGCCLLTHPPRYPQTLMMLSVRPAAESKRIDGAKAEGGRSQASSSGERACRPPGMPQMVREQELLTYLNTKIINCRWPKNIFGGLRPIRDIHKVDLAFCGPPLLRDLPHCGVTLYCGEPS